LKRLSWTLVALVAAGVFLFVRILPARPAAVDVSAWADLVARTVPGAYHVHTTRSDGMGDRAAVAAAAARAGLGFVIVTDHGDGTRPPDPPDYIGGVLMLDAVEISTIGGHYVALEMPRAPYPLGGAADAVVEDVRRLGGFGIAAHPDSPKPALRWTDAQAPIDGIEWLNTDSEWRDEPRSRLARAVAGYFLRPGPAIAALFDRPVTLERWDQLTRFRQVVALAAADAHGGVGRAAEDTGRTFFGTAGIPKYEASFRAFSNRVVLDRPLTGTAAADAQAIYGAIRRGSVFSTIDALAAPAALDFHVEAALGQIPMGGVLPEDSDATIVARAATPPGAELVLLHNGHEVATGRGEIRHGVTEAHGAYRVEVRLPGAPGTPPVPWLVGNPVYLGASASPIAPPVEAPAAAARIAPFPWRIEKDAASSATLRPGAHEVELVYTLAGGEASSQFVALATDVQRQAFAAIDLGLSGDRPLRVSVQVRTANGQRWGRSYYVEPSGSNLRIPLSSLRPIDSAPATVASIDVTSILLVIDLVNAEPGRSGTLRVKGSALTN
jgi:hypothetical protein